LPDVNFQMGRVNLVENTFKDSEGQVRRSVPGIQADVEMGAAQISATRLFLGADVEW
jgi:hypothetical protein